MKTDKIVSRLQVSNLVTDEYINSYTHIANREGLKSIDELIDNIFEICYENNGDEEDALSLFNIQHNIYQDEISSL